MANARCQPGVKIYGVTKQFPQDVRVGLTNQIGRSVVSIPSNIAEGQLGG